MRMTRITMTTTLTVRKMVRAPQRIGESFDGILGFGGALPDMSGFCPGTASSTPSLVGGGFLPDFGESLTSGLISVGMVLVRSGQRKSDKQTYNNNIGHALRLMSDNCDYSMITTNKKALDLAI